MRTAKRKLQRSSCFFQCRKHPCHSSRWTLPPVGIVQTLPVGICTKQGSLYFWHHLLDNEVQPAFEDIGNIDFAIPTIDCNLASYFLRQVGLRIIVDINISSGGDFLHRHCFSTAAFTSRKSCFLQKWPFRAPTTGTSQGGSGLSAAVGTWLYLLPFCWVTVFRFVTRSSIFQSDNFEPHLTHQTGHLNFPILLNLLFFLLIIFHNLHSLRLHKLIFLNVELFFCFPVYSASSLTSSIKVIMYLISFCMLASLTEQMLMSSQERKAATSGLLCFVVLHISRVLACVKPMEITIQPVTPIL